MTVYNHSLEAMLSNLSDAENTDHSSDARTDELRRHTLAFTYKAATSLRDFREAYGYKMTPPYMFQEAAIAAFILLRAPDSDPQVLQETRPGNANNLPISDVITAFEECFRCLLGCGVQIMLTRGIARMVYHTAIQLKVQLPEMVEQMLHIIAETAWQPSDLPHFNSVYRNFAIASRRDARAEEYQMEEVLRKFEDSRADEDHLLNHRLPVRNMCAAKRPCNPELSFSTDSMSFS